MAKKPLMNVLLKEERASMKNPVGYCGNHCGFCSFKFCGGCRCDYVGNSYKVACGGSCPNIVCAKEKGLEGCYLCDDLENCQKGFYSKPKEYAGKATALFIKKHGKKSCTKTLQKAIDEGAVYPKKFNAKGSVEKALELLEKYSKN